MGCKAYDWFEDGIKDAVSGVTDWFVDEVLDDYLGVVPGRGGLIGDLLQGADEYLFHGGLEDDIKSIGRWIDDEIIQPVYEFQKAFVNTMLDDPLYAIAMITAAVVYPPAIPYIQGIKVKSDGGSWGDALEAGVKAYVTQQVMTSTNVQGLEADISGGTLSALEAAGITGPNAVAIADAFGNISTAGLTTGTIDVITGGSFTDGFVSGASMAGAQIATNQIMGYIEDQLPDKFNFKQAETNADGNVITADGDRVFNDAGQQLDVNGNVATASTPKNMLRQANDVYKQLPDVVQNVMATGISAKLQGKELTPEMLYLAATETLITAELVGSTLNKVKGIDLTGEDGELFLSYLTPSVQKTAAQILDMGLGEESGVATANNLMEAIDKYGQYKLFTNTLELMENTEFVIDAYQKIDALRGNLSNVKNLADDFKTKFEAWTDLLADNNAIANDRLVLVEELEALQDAYGSTIDGAAFDAAIKEWSDSFTEQQVEIDGVPQFETDADGNQILDADNNAIPITETVPTGYPANAGFTSFEDYYTELARINNYASYDQVAEGKAAISRQIRRLEQFDINNQDEYKRINEAITAGTLKSNYETAYRAYLEGQATLNSDINNLGSEFSVEFDRKAASDFVRMVNPSFDEAFYQAKYADQIEAGSNAFEHYITEGAKNGLVVSAGQEDAIEKAAKAAFKQAVLVDIFGQTGALNVTNKLTTSELNQLNFYIDDSFANNFNIDDYKTVQYYDENGVISPTYVEGGSY